MRIHQNRSLGIVDIRAAQVHGASLSSLREHVGIFNHRLYIIMIRSLLKQFHGFVEIAVNKPSIPVETGKNLHRPGAAFHDIELQILDC